MMIESSLIPLPFDLDVREDESGLYARMLFRAAPVGDVDVLLVLESEIRVAFQRSSEDLDWDRVTLDRYAVDDFVAHEVHVPKVPMLTPLVLH